MKFKKVFDLYMKYLKRIRQKTSTISRYMYLYESHLCSFEDSDISKIQNIDIDIFIDKKIEFLSPQYINDMLILIYAVIDFAVSEGISKANKLKRRKIREDTKKIEVFAEQEQVRIESHCIAISDNISLSVLFTLTTGLRIGELCALKKSNFDFDRSTVYISKTLQRVKNLDNSNIKKTKIIIEDVKSSSSCREIPVPRMIMIMIEKVLQGKNNDVFLLTGSKKFIEPRTLENKYKALLNDCKVDYKTFHVLRHTFATFAIRSGMDIKTLSELLGHSSVKITLERYVHSDLQTKATQMDIMNTAFIKRHEALYSCAL